MIGLCPEVWNLANVPLKVTPGQRIAQIVPIPLVGKSKGYSGSYQNSGAKPRFSLATNDWEAAILREINKDTGEIID
jgi:hypothetical protein